MPIKLANRKLYPKNWADISNRIRFGRAKGCCEFCGAEHGQAHPVTGSIVVLTVAHLDHDPAHNDDDNLRALCQKCHNSYDVPHRKHGVGREQMRLPGIDALAEARREYEAEVLADLMATIREVE